SVIGDQLLPERKRVAELPVGSSDGGRLSRQGQHRQHAREPERYGSSPRDDASNQRRIIAQHAQSFGEAVLQWLRDTDAWWNRGYVFAWRIPWPVRCRWCSDLETQEPPSFPGSGCDCRSCWCFAPVCSGSYCGSL